MRSGWSIGTKGCICTVEELSVSACIRITWTSSKEADFWAPHRPKESPSLGSWCRNSPEVIQMQRRVGGSVSEVSDLSIVTQKAAEAGFPLRSLGWLLETLRSWDSTNCHKSWFSWKGSDFLGLPRAKGCSSVEKLASSAALSVP